MFKRVRCALVVCPPSLMDNWSQELERWGPFQVEVFHSGGVTSNNKSGSSSASTSRNFSRDMGMNVSSSDFSNKRVDRILEKVEAGTCNVLI